MKKQRVVVDAHAEEAIYALMGTAADALDEHSIPTSRRPRLSPTTYGPSADYGYAAISSMIAVVENYVVDASCAKLRAAFPTASQMAVDGLRIFERQIGQSWTERQRVLKRWLKLDFSKCTAWSKVDTYIEARNSIMHGRGALTPIQLAAKGAALTLPKKFDAQGMGMLSGRLSIRREAIVGCAHSSRDLIVWFDEWIRGAGLIDGSIG